eukprot:scaffold9905_cov117-Isochrysis_galbana.AAC.5
MYALSRIGRGSSTLRPPDGMTLDRLRRAEQCHSVGSLRPAPSAGAELDRTTVCALSAYTSTAPGGKCCKLLASTPASQGHTT